MLKTSLIIFSRTMPLFLSEWFTSWHPCWLLIPNTRANSGRHIFATFRDAHRSFHFHRPHGSSTAHDYVRLFPAWTAASFDVGLPAEYEFPGIKRQTWACEGCACFPRSDIIDWQSGSNSVVECDLAKVEVAGSNPVSRSSDYQPSPPRGFSAPALLCPLLIGQRGRGPGAVAKW